MNFADEYRRNVDRMIKFRDELTKEQREFFDSGLGAMVETISTLAIMGLHESLRMSVEGKTDVGWMKMMILHKKTIEKTKNTAPFAYVSEFLIKGGREVMEEISEKASACGKEEVEELKKKLNDESILVFPGSKEIN